MSASLVSTIIPIHNLNHVMTYIVCNMSVRAKTETPPVATRLWPAEFVILLFYSRIIFRTRTAVSEKLGKRFFCGHYTYTELTCCTTDLYTETVIPSIYKCIAVSGTRVNRHYSPGLWRKPRVVTPYIIILGSGSTTHHVLYFNPRPNLLSSSYIFTIVIPPSYIHDPIT